MSYRTFNGWIALPEYPTEEFIAPGGKHVYVNSRGGDEVKRVFEYIARRWHNEIEPIAQSHPDNRRKPRERHGYTKSGKWDAIGIHSWRPPTTKVGTKSQSNHCSATAMDINGHLHPYEASAPAHKRGAGYHDGFSDKQRRKLREIANSVRDANGNVIIRLGIDFAVGKRDGMHVEIAPGVSRQQVREAADRLSPAAPEWQTTEHIKSVQRLLNDVIDAGLTVDGKRGEKTEAATLRFQTEHAWHGLEPDGSPGPKTLEALETDMASIMESIKGIQESLKKIETVELSPSTARNLFTARQKWSLSDYLNLLGNRMGRTDQRAHEVAAEVEGIKEALKAVATASGGMTREEIEQMMTETVESAKVSLTFPADPETDG